MRRFPELHPDERDEAAVAGQREPMCAVPGCPNIGTVDVVVQHGVFWPDGRNLGALAEKAKMCVIHVEQLCRERLIRAQR